jgi:hypothetical protein
MSPLESQCTALRAVAARSAHGNRSAHLRYLLLGHELHGSSVFCIRPVGSVHAVVATLWRPRRPVSVRAMSVNRRCALAELALADRFVAG